MSPATICRQAMFFLLAFLCVGELTAQTSVKSGRISREFSVADFDSLETCEKDIKDNVRTTEDDGLSCRCSDPGAGFEWRLQSSLVSGTPFAENGIAVVNASGELVTDSAFLFNLSTKVFTIGSDLSIDCGAGDCGLDFTPGAAQTKAMAVFDTDAFVITDDRKVGIGTANPLSPLSITSSTAPDIRMIGNNSVVSSNGTITFASANAAGALFLAVGANAATNGVDRRVSVDANGNLDILAGNLTVDGCTFFGKASTGPSGVACDTYYDTDINKLCVHNGTSFRESDDYTTACI